MVYFRMFSSALTKIPFNFFGNGKIERDFTFISDVTSILMSLESELKTRGNGFFDFVNVGGGKPCSINQVLNLIESITETKIPYNRQEANKIDVKRTSADYSYLNSLIMNYPTVQIEQGLSAFYEWAIQPGIIDKLSTWVRSVN